VVQEAADYAAGAARPKSQWSATPTPPAASPTTLRLPNAGLRPPPTPWLGWINQSTLKVDWKGKTHLAVQTADASRTAQQTLDHIDQLLTSSRPKPRADQLIARVFARAQNAV